jgi:virulence factor Mce-like protein
VALALLAQLPACALLPGSGGERRVLTAFFPRAAAFFKGSHVKLMGNDVGRVRSVSIDGDRIKVVFSVAANVPLPADVNVAIVPLTLVGERNLVLFPPWKPGVKKMVGNPTIPPERTRVPVETDDALKAFTDLAEAIDPQAVQKLAISGTAALRDRGPLINDALNQMGQLATIFGSQDDRLVAVAKSLHTLATTVNAREAQFSKLLTNFSTVSAVLAQERDKIASLLEALARVPSEGEKLLTELGNSLPTTIATLARLALILEGNVDSVRLTVQGLADFAQGFVEAWNPNTGALRVRAFLTPLTASVLQPLYDALGLGTAPCVPVQLECPGLTP